MKKVLFTATVDSHILQFHLPFLKLFKEKGYEVHVATNGNEEIPYCDVKHVVCFERSPFKVDNLRAIQQLKKIINKEKFDIIHCHTPMGSVVTRLAARQARKKYNTRVIYTAHGFHFYKGCPLKSWILYYPVEWYLSKYTDTLITINMEDYELAKKKFSRRCKDINYVPGVGIDNNRFINVNSNNVKKEMQEKFNLNEKNFVLTCVARLDKNKNQVFLIDAMEILTKKYDNIRLLLIGPDEYDGKYHKVCREKKLDKYVFFLGKRDDIPELLSISNVIVTASHREGLPVNIIEALASNLPVVALKCRGVSELVSNEINGYVCDNMDDFVSSVEKIYLMSLNELAKMKKANFDKSQKYSILEIITLYKKVYFK